MDDVISNFRIHNQIINFDTLNDHDPNSNDRHLTANLNFSMHKGPIGENSNHQSHILFEKKNDILLKDLNSELNMAASPC
jgi:hypothetical protein